MMAAETTGIRIDQVLHGYGNGHRRLAGSIALDDASSSIMLVLSDLLSSSLSDPNSSYLTGYPLRSAHKYVLARTWPAPEIRRPGCVWTHSLVLDYGTLAQLIDPERLLCLFHRPQPQDFGSFAEPISAAQILFGELPKLDSERQLVSLDVEKAIAAIFALYGDVGRRELVLTRTNPEQDEALAIAIWRQMWPRLRRGFLFATCVSGRIDGVEADFSLLMTPDRSPDNSNTHLAEPLISHAAPRRGFEILLSDLYRVQQTPLRRFLSRYATDARDQREAAAPLAEIYAALSQARHPDALVSAAARMRLLFGDSAECRLLKTDFLLGRLHDDGAASGVDGSDAFLAMLAAFHDTPSFVDRDTLAARLSSLHQQGKVALSDILEYSVPSEPGNLGDLVINSAAGTLSPCEIAAVKCHVSVKIRLAVANPHLLGQRQFWPESSEHRIQILSAVPEIQNDLDEIIEALLPRMSASDAAFLLQHHGATAASIILNRLAQLASPPSDLPAIAGTLLRFPEPLQSGLVNAGPLPLWLLTELANRIDGSPVEDQLSWETWATVVTQNNWRDRLTGHYHFASLLFKAALDAPITFAAALFRASFDPLHESAAANMLPFEIRNRLAKRLPYIGYFDDWDFCAKLRTAAINRYLATDIIDPSLLYITENPKTLAVMLNGVGDTSRGRRMLESLHSRLRTGVYMTDPVRLSIVEKAVENSRSLSWW